MSILGTTGFFARWKKLMRLQHKHYSFVAWPRWVTPDIRDSLVEGLIYFIAFPVLVAMIAAYPLWAPVWAFVLRPIIKAAKLAAKAAKYDMAKIDEVEAKLGRKEEE